MNSRQVTCIVVSWFFVLLAILAVGARLIARTFIIRSVKVDDYVLLLSLFAYLGWNILGVLEIQHGLGKTGTEVDLNDISDILKYIWANLICYNVSITLIKVSILLQFLRFIVTTWTTRAIWAMIFLSTAWGLSVTLSSIFLCTPIQGFWQLKIHRKCIDFTKLSLAQAIMNVLTDLMIFMLPIPKLLVLQVPKRQKIGLIFILSIGALVCIISIIRLRIMLEIIRQPPIAMINGTIPYIWTDAEVAAALICASLPGIKPFFTRRKTPTGLVDSADKRGRLPSSTAPESSNESVRV